MSCSHGTKLPKRCQRLSFSARNHSPPQQVSRTFRTPSGSGSPLCHLRGRGLLQRAQAASASTWVAQRRASSARAWSRWARAAIIDCLYASFSPPTLDNSAIRESRSAHSAALLSCSSLSSARRDSTVSSPRLGSVPSCSGVVPFMIFMCAARGASSLPVRARQVGSGLTTPTCPRRTPVRHRAPCRHQSCGSARPVKDHSVSDSCR